MVEEIINNIIQAEEQAENIVKDSQNKAREMVAQAKDISIAMLEDETKRVDSEIQAMVNDARAKADREAQDVIANCEKEAQAMEDKAKANEGAALDFIIGRMMSKYDN